MKKIMSVIIMTSLLLSSIVTGFAAEDNSNKNSIESPILVGEKFTFTDLKVEGGTLASGYIKVTEASIVKKDAQDAFKNNGVKLTKEDLMVKDLYKIGLEVSFTGYNGDSSTSLKKTLPTISGMNLVHMSKADAYESVLTSGFNGGLESDFGNTPDSKVVMRAGKYAGTKISQIDLAKPFTYKGVVYARFAKNKFDGLRLKVTVSAKDASTQDSGIYFQLKKNEKLVNVLTTKTYGTARLGEFETDLKLVETKEDRFDQMYKNYVYYVCERPIDKTGTFVLLRSDVYEDGCTFEDYYKYLDKYYEEDWDFQKFSSGKAFIYKAKSKTDETYVIEVFYDVDGTLRYCTFGSEDGDKETVEKLWESFNKKNKILGV